MIKFNQSGYVGQSMSVRAKAAYDNDEMPMSKWSKSSILEIVGQIYGEEVENLCSKKTLADLRAFFLEYTAWHHTGSYSQRVDFYQINEDLEIDDILKFANEISEPKKREKIGKVTKFALAKYEEWGGTRRHPIKTTKIDVFSWTEKGFKCSLAIELKTGVQKRVESLNIIETLDSKPRKNAKIWDRCK